MTKGRDLPPLRLLPGEERRIESGHAWVFSNEVDTTKTPLGDFAPGSMASVVSSRDRFLGYAYVNPQVLICARILGRNAAEPPGRALLEQRLRRALALRERLYARPYYRLVYGESDGLPGLVLDRYGDLVVGQSGTAGIDAMADDIVAAVRAVIGAKQFVWKNDSGARELEQLPETVTADSGAVPDETGVEENGLSFRAPLAAGQKTGWFYDQTGNRAMLRRHVKGARVLDVCSYVGGWGISAAENGARDVLCVDASATALGYVERAATARSLPVRTLRGDAFDALEDLAAAGERYDVVVLDPPAFIKRRKQAAKGEAAYRRLNQLGLQLVADDGLLVSCSCSYHLEPQSLLDALQKAARNTGRFVQVIETGGQAPDHPVHPAIPETRYLKAFFCRVTQE
ncbi:MAG: class I SAM-dependent rRNA methyltransferase [Gammaproteobacteria bacterium]|nr:class I SAM-dependent rRNA methyltransferase [Gammaproteobacteria bacterium]